METQDVRLRTKSDGWDTANSRKEVHYRFIDVGGWQARIAIIGEGDDKAEDLAQDIIDGLSLLEQTVTIKKYKRGLSHA